MTGGEHFDIVLVTLYKAFEFVPFAFAVLLVLIGSSNRAFAGDTSFRKESKVARNIYVANSCTNEVTAYPVGSNGNVMPLRTQIALGPPTGIAIGPSGEIYVSDTCRRVVVYPPGSNGVVAPVRVISGRETGLTSSFGSATNAGIAVDPSANLFVLNGQQVNNPGPDPTQVAVFSTGSNGNVAPAKTIVGSQTDLSWYPVGIALDANGQIYVATSSTDDSGGGDGVLVFAPGSNGNSAPNAVLGGQNSGIFSVDSVAVDSRQNIYVLNGARCYYYCPNSANVTVYAPGSNGDATPIATLNIPTESPIFASGPSAITIGPRDELFVAMLDGSIVAYAPGAKGNASPVATLGGPDTGLNPPRALAFGTDGKLYVANAFPRSITVYAPGASGDAKPIATIADSPNGMGNPTGIAISPYGRIYVSNYSQYTDFSITTYARRTFAIEPPILTIAGVRANFAYPHDLALDPTGNVYLLNLNDLSIFSRGSHGNARPRVTIPGSFIDLGVDSHRNIYTTFSGSDAILIYQASGKHAAQIGSISGSETGLAEPGPITVDPKNNLYVANAAFGGTPSLEIFKPGSIGNVAPRTVISGPHTGLAQSEYNAIATDKEGNIYLTDFGDDAIVIYAGGSSGDVAPIATIVGPATGIADPTGIAIGP